MDRLKERLLEQFNDMVSANNEVRLDEQQSTKLFKYSKQEHTLYSFVQAHNKNALMPQQTNLMLSWDFN